MSILEHPKIQELRKHVSDQEILEKQGLLNLYLRDPDNYQVILEPELNVVNSIKLVNPGVYYLEDSYFDLPLELDQFEINEDASGDCRSVILARFANLDSAIIYGGNGIGKTSYCIACANKAYEKYNVKFLYVSWPDVINGCFNFGDKNNYIEQLKRAPYLIIDDLGFENITHFSRDNILLPIINHRLEKSLMTIVITNFSAKELIPRYMVDKHDDKICKTLESKLYALGPEIKCVGRNWRNGV